VPPQVTPNGAPLLECPDVPQLQVEQGEVTKAPDQRKDRKQERDEGGSSELLCQVWAGC